MIIFGLFMFLLFLSIGVLCLVKPKKVTYWSHNFNRGINKQFYNNYEKVEPNENMFALTRFIGVLVIIIAFTTFAPIFKMMVPNERDAHQIVSESNQLSIEYPVNDDGMLFNLLKYSSDRYRLTSEEQAEVESLFKGVRVGIAFSKGTPERPYLSNNYQYAPFDFLELNVEGGTFVFYSDNTAYIISDEHGTYPLRGDYSEVYDYLLNLRGRNTE